jgi:hypothetical protein
MLSRALSLEESKMAPILRGLLNEVERSDLNEKTKREMMQRVNYLLEGTLEHSARLNEIIREVTWSAADRF